MVDCKCSHCTLVENARGTLAFSYLTGKCCGGGLSHWESLIRAEALEDALFRGPDGLDAVMLDLLAGRKTGCPTR